MFYIILYRKIGNLLSIESHYFCNENYSFNEFDKKRLSELDIDICYVEPDYGEPTPYMVRCNAFVHTLKNKSSHRLFLEPDTIALNEPLFDLSCDWQAMYASSAGNMSDISGT